MTPIVSGEIAEDFTNYFATSEQTPSVIALGVLVDKNGVKEAGGYKLSLMPDATDEIITKIEEQVKNIEPISKMLDENKTLEEIAKAVTGDENLQILSEVNPEYQCNCSKEKCEKGLIAIGKKEIPVGDYMMELNLPAQIKVASPKMDLFTLNFDSKLGEGKKLPFTMKVDMTVDNPLLEGVFEDKKLDLISLVVEQDKEANFNAKLSLEAGLKKLAGMLENMLKSKVDLPDAFLLTVKLTELDNFRVPCSLFAVAGEITLPLGDAVIGLNLSSIC